MLMVASQRCTLFLLVNAGTRLSEHKKNYRYIQYVRLIQVRKLSEIGWTVMTTNVAGGHQSYLFSLVGDTLSSGNGCG